MAPTCMPFTGFLRFIEFMSYKARSIYLTSIASIPEVTKFSQEPDTVTKTLMETKAQDPCRTKSENTDTNPTPYKPGIEALKTIVHLSRTNLALNLAELFQGLGNLVHFLKRSPNTNNSGFDVNIIVWL